MILASETGHRSSGRDEAHAATAREPGNAADQAVSFAAGAGGHGKPSDSARGRGEYCHATDELSESAPSDHVWPDHHRR